ncbi:MAG: hypothetical protein M3P95_00035 [Actinomycetota bacterium]|nr:hypothetical protein [Actinomycetota bacterium]
MTTGTQGLQFGAVGGHVWQRARERDLGTPFPTEWFLQTSGTEQAGAFAARPGCVRPSGAAR